jgi:16S rRNA (guanine527-N7)-methyltransferase
MDIDYSSIRDALLPFGASLTPALADSLRSYLALLLRWNLKINLTATSDVREILRRHVGESLFAARLLTAERGTLYDVGSGAGFPGLPLKLVRPDWDLVLVESDHRKAAFLSEAVRTLKLERARVLPQRFASIPSQTLKADVIASRALGQLDDLLEWSAAALKPSGRIILWLGAKDAENLRIAPTWTWDPVMPLPESRERVLLVGSPLK